MYYSSVFTVVELSNFLGGCLMMMMSICDISCLCIIVVALQKWLLGTSVSHAHTVNSECHAPRAVE